MEGMEGGREGGTSKQKERRMRKLYCPAGILSSIPVLGYTRSPATRNFRTGPYLTVGSLNMQLVKMRSHWRKVTPPKNQNKTKFIS